MLNIALWLLSFGMVFGDSVARPSPEALNVAETIATSLQDIFNVKDLQLPVTNGSKTTDTEKIQPSLNQTGDELPTSPQEPDDSHTETTLKDLIHELWPAAKAAVGVTDSELESESESESASKPTQGDGESSSEDTEGSGKSSLHAQIDTYWHALNDFLGDTDLGQPGEVDAALEKLFGPQESDSGEEKRDESSAERLVGPRNRDTGEEKSDKPSQRSTKKLVGPQGRDSGEERKSDESSPRSARYRVRKLRGNRRNAKTEKPVVQPETQTGTAENSEKADSNVTKPHTILNSTNMMMDVIKNQSDSDESTDSLKLSKVLKESFTEDSLKPQSNAPSDSEEKSSDESKQYTEDDVMSGISSADEPMEHRDRPAPHLFRQRQTARRVLASLRRQLPGLEGALTNATLGRVLARQLNKAARDGASRGMLSSASSVRMFAHILASRRAAAASNNSSGGGSSSDGSGTSQGEGGDRRPFSLRTLGRLLANRRAVISANSDANGEADDDTDMTSDSAGHASHNRSPSRPSNRTAERGTSRGGGGRRPTRVTVRLLPHRQGSRTSSTNSTQQRQPTGQSDNNDGDGRDEEEEVDVDSWTTSASVLLASLLTPGRLTDTVSEAVGRASSRFTDQLLGRLTGPLQTVTGRASNRLSRLPRLLAPVQRLLMGELAEPARPGGRARQPRSELERLQQRLRYTESVQRATAAELARLRRTAQERRLAGRAGWSVAAAERSGDLMAHLWTLQP